jgi:hypothetical protein
MCVAGLVVSLAACGTQPTAHPANATRTISGVSLTVGGTSNPPPPSGTNGLVEAFGNKQLTGAPVAAGTTSAANGGRFVLHVPPGVYFVAAKIVSFSYPIRVDVTTASATGLRIENPIP